MPSITKPMTDEELEIFEDGRDFHADLLQSIHETEIVNLVVASLVKFMRRICLRWQPPWRTLFRGIPDSNKPYGFCSNCG